MKVNNDNAVGQRILSELVDREVIYCVSCLISDLSQDDKYMDDLMPVLCLYDYEEPARENGWDEDDDGIIFKLPVYEDDYENDDLVEVARDLDLLVEEDMDESGPTAFFWTRNSEKFGPYNDEDDANEAMVLANLDVLKAKYEADNHIVVDSWQEACDEARVDPYQRDVFEHWIVSNWLACKLEEEGEATTEFMGLTIWGRTTSGQSICMDGVIERIYNKLHSDDAEDVA